MRTLRVVAVIFILTDLPFHVGAVALELAGRGKFSELMAHHIFTHVHGQKLFAIVDIECQPHEVGHDGGTA